MFLFFSNHRINFETLLIFYLLTTTRWHDWILSRFCQDLGRRNLWFWKQDVFLSSYVTQLPRIFFFQKCICTYYYIYVSKSSPLDFIQLSIYIHLFWLCMSPGNQKISKMIRSQDVKQRKMFCLSSKHVCYDWSKLLSKERYNVIIYRFT